MAILDALKKLGKKMTGGPVQGTDIESAIDSIANNYSGGGGNILVVRFTYDDEDNVFCDKTYSEIEAAYKSASPMVGYDGENLLTTITTIDYDGQIGYRFSSLGAAAFWDGALHAINLITCVVMPDGSVIEEYFEKNFD